MAVNLHLKQRGESFGLNERKLGDILTSLSLKNRTRKNIGYVLWLYREDRARIHATARDYRIEGTDANLIDECQICTPIGRPAPGTLPAPTNRPVEAQMKTEKMPNREGRVRRERRVRRSRGLRFRARVEGD